MEIRQDSLLDFICFICRIAKLLTDPCELYPSFIQSSPFSFKASYNIYAKLVEN